MVSGNRYDIARHLSVGFGHQIFADGQENRRFERRSQLYQEAIFPIVANHPRIDVLKAYKPARNRYFCPVTPQVIAKLALFRRLPGLRGWVVLDQKI